MAAPIMRRESRDRSRALSHKVSCNCGQGRLTPATHSMSIAGTALRFVDKHFCRRSERSARDEWASSESGREQTL